MAKFEILMPKLGESIQEGTITKWFVKEGDVVKEDDMLFEVATDKVDSEIPSPVDGKIEKILFEADSLVAVGEIIAVVLLDQEDGDEKEDENEKESNNNSSGYDEEKDKIETKESSSVVGRKHSNRFFSPLVRTIAKKEGITAEELESVKGSGFNGRIQKNDLLNYIESRKNNKPKTGRFSSADKEVASYMQIQQGDKVVEMDRVRKLIADHMVRSKQISPHVTSVVEADVTDIVLWRKNNKDDFQNLHGEKITFMPFFIEATAAALKEFPMVNSSVDGDKIILRKNINIGIAVAKNDGNLIVPVIKNAEQKNLAGLSAELNRLADAARNNKLIPEEIQGGTFTITNFGTFRNIIGTPIINQPQAAILATGSIEKKPAVIETPAGDAIAIRHKMFLSLSYDHRIVDGALGGAFLRKIADNLEEFNTNLSI